MSWDNTSERNSYFWLFSRSLLKPICSPLLTTDYAAGEFLSDTVASLESGSRMPLIRWANDDNIVYTREHIPLRVSVDDSGHLLSLDERSCPRLFVRVRDATPGRVAFSRNTRVDEVQDVTCKMESAHAPHTRFIMDFDASYSLTRKNDRNMGEYTLEISSLAKLKARHLLVGSTNGLHLSMVAGKFIRRNWGSPVEGIAVSLTLDKDVYDLGSDVPLHIALENVDSPATIAAMDPYYDPPGAGVELQDSNGHPIPVRPGAGAGWMGHGLCHHFLPGLVFSVELTLSQMGFRPDRPGVYKVVATWSPSVNGVCWGTPGRSITVRSSPVTFRLVDHPSAPASPGGAMGNSVSK